jgi:hypothetical protein
VTINKLKGGATSAHLGGSAIYPKGVSEEGVSLMRLIFDEPLDNFNQIFVSRLVLPISLRVIS